ncbi:MAG TPA: fumarylacetoacetate hydrolase family protein [Lacisediminihabitans sp.]|uniref:2-keto-4-pentenoate hydratase n=1 Tax=Lacisediminihabitans sp. TaxID=2787631 RepID=UPI002EDA8DE5
MSIPAGSLTAESIAAALIEAERTGRTLPIEIGQALAPGVGYAAQDIEVATRIEAGDALAGFKVGLTVPTAQASMGVDHPGYGRLHTSMLLSSPAVIRVTNAPQPVMLECEVAVTLRADLTVDRLEELLADRASVDLAVASVHVAAEVVTGRWDRAVSTWEAWAADNGCSFQAVFGTPQQRVPLGRIFSGTITVNGTAHEGQSVRVDDTLGWLAKQLATTSTPLFPGAVILTGAVVGPVPVQAGDAVELSIDGLGAVAVHVE